jgi:hypothetical protein
MVTETRFNLTLNVLAVRYGSRLGQFGMIHAQQHADLCRSSSILVQPAIGAWTNMTLAAVREESKLISTASLTSNLAPPYR